MANDRIKKEWDSFTKAVMPPDVHPIQYTEMRRAFFGGAHAMLNLVAEASAKGKSVESGATVLEELTHELAAFMARVGTGDY